MVEVKVEMVAVAAAAVAVAVAVARGRWGAAVPVASVARHKAIAAAQA